MFLRTFQYRIKEFNFIFASLLFTILLLAPNVILSQTYLITDTYGIVGDPQSPSDYTLHASGGDIPNGQNGWVVKASSHIATSDTMYPNQLSSTDKFINVNLTINRTGNLAIGDQATLEYSFDGGTTYYAEPLGDFSGSNRIYFARTFYLDEISVFNVRISLNTTVSQAKWWITSGDLNLNQSPTADSLPTSISYFTGSDESTFPIELLSFSANAYRNAVQLNWATATELNNDYFEIERSYDGESYESIGRENGVGNSIVVTEYQFIDESCSNGIAYYRLRQVDYNGEYTYSNIIQYFNKQNTKIVVYPNPAKDIVKIVLNHNDIEFIEVRNVSGKVVSMFRMDEELFYSMDVSDFEQGLYILTAHGNNESVSKKLIVSR